MQSFFYGTIHGFTPSVPFSKLHRTLTDDKIDCALEKGNSNENFKYYFSSLRRKNLNRVILAQLNINSIRNKFDLLAEGIKGKVDVLMISETKIDETFLENSILKDFHLLTVLIETVTGVVFLCMSERIFRLS